MSYYAHSGNHVDLRDGQPLAEHLLNVAALAQKMAGDTGWVTTGLSDAAFGAGLHRDLKKYREGFQRYLQQIRTPREERLHKQAGAAKAADCKLAPTAFVIYGHHGGLPDQADLDAGLKSGRRRRLKGYGRALSLIVRPWRR